MQSDQIIFHEIEIKNTNKNQNKKSSGSGIKLFSLFVFFTFTFGIYRWYGYYSQSIGNRKWQQLTKYDYLDLMQYDNGYNMEEIALKYRIYLVPLIPYTQPNIFMAICIILTFFTVINFIEKQSATPIAFFQFNLCSIYLQIVRILMDIIHYFITSKCICLVSGGGAIWMHLLTKIVYYNAKNLANSNFQIITITITYLTAFTMIILKDRVDLLIAIMLALLDIKFLQGGTIKYPKEVFQEKQDWAEAIRVNRSSLWQNFNWNEYSVNEQLCVDSIQFYISRKDRIIMISKD